MGVPGDMNLELLDYLTMSKTWSGVSILIKFPFCLLR